MSNTFIAVGMDIDSVFGKFGKEWLSTGSDGDETGGWFRYLHYTTGRSIECEYGADKRITRIWNNSWMTDRTYI